MKAETIGSKVKQHSDTMIITTTASSLAKKARSSIVDADRTCSYRRSGENELWYAQLSRQSLCPTTHMLWM